MQKETVVAFVNSKSGGQQGKHVLRKLLLILPKNQVYDLFETPPSVGLSEWKGKKFRVLACGGDGTVGWLLSEIDKLFEDNEFKPPVAVMPLGTGNDMARTLQWGGSHAAKKLAPFLAAVEEGTPMQLDRWRLSFYPSPSLDGSAPLESKIMNNYFSIGADAQIAMNFHEAREAKPHRFQSRAQNYAWYFRFGLHRFEALHDVVELQIDNRIVPISPAIEAILFLNISSYAGGSHPWGRPHPAKSHYAPSALDDGLLEVVGITSNFHIATIHAHVNSGVRLGQGRHVVLTTQQPVAAQIDGEPWILPPTRMVVNQAGTGVMLANNKPLPATPTTTNVHPSPQTSPVYARPFTRQASAHFPSQPLSVSPTNELKGSAPQLCRTEQQQQCQGCDMLCVPSIGAIDDHLPRCSFTFS